MNPVTRLGRVFSLAALSLTAAAQNPSLPAFPAVRLSEGSRGAGIIASLGNRLPLVAQWYGLTAQQLGGLCLRDYDLRTDRTGRLHYACAAIPAPTAQNGGTEALLTWPASQTFLLHSKPGSSRVIYLDCNGHITSGTVWNDAYTAGVAFTTPAYDTNGDAASFISGELANIQEIWKSVSEDYSAWDVDVTTEEPASDSLRKTSESDTAYGVRVVIGGSSNQWLGFVAGGVAYLTSFSWDSDTPVYVFPAELGSGWPKYVAEAASHEIGHSVGLSHDGTSSMEYYAGHNGWAPIMGDGYTATVTQFSKGEYSGANNTQDDTSLIDTYIPRSADLAGDDILTAVPLDGTSVSATGIIGSRNDADLYKLQAGGGTLSFNAIPAAPGANLDVSLSLYNGVGNLVASGSNTSALSATLTASLTAGTYYLAVDGVGTGTVSTGYSDYGSLGQFTLTGTLPGSGGQPPVASMDLSAPLSGRAPLTVAFSSSGSSDPEGGVLTYDWDFGDRTTSTVANPSHLYSAAGSYTASLVVVDVTGLSASASKVITVLNSPPVVSVALSAPTSGLAPLTVAFSSSGSSDPDGGALTYQWTFGDGTGSMAANPSHLYTAAGNYTATLVVTDVAGLTASASKVITVQPALPATAIYVSDIVMSKATGTRGTQAKAIVTIKDGTGKLKANATVSGAWTGLTASSASVKTGSAGTAPFLSAWTNLNGTFTFKVTKVVLSGFTYTPAANVETTDFIAK